MANIAEYLKNIKSAILGRDVRDSIHDGMDAINKDCTERLNGQDDKLTEQDTIIENNVARQDLLERKYDEQIKNIASSEPQNAEIVDARNGFDTLGKVLKQKIYHFSNVEEMKNCVNLVEGDVVQTLGYYEENDGGGGTYKIRLKEDADVEDGGSVHFLSNALVAEIVKEVQTFYNVLQYGFDNSGNIDMVEKFNNLINSIGKNSKKVDLYFPAGIYKFSEGIELPPYWKLYGNNLKLYSEKNITTTFYFECNKNDFIALNIKYQSEIHDIEIFANNCYDCKIERDNLLNDNDVFSENIYFTNTYGITCQNSNNVIYNIKISNFYYGINLYTYNYLRDCLIRKCHYGIRCSNDNSIDNIRFYDIHTCCYVGGGINNFSNLRADSLCYGLVIYGSGNNLNNIILDWCYNAFIKFSDGHRNNIKNISGRGAISCYGKDSSLCDYSSASYLDMSNCLFIFTNNASNNTLICSISDQFNEKDDANNPVYIKPTLLFSTIAEQKNTLIINTDIDISQKKNFKRLFYPNTLKNISATINNKYYEISNLDYNPLNFTVKTSSLEELM